MSYVTTGEVTTLEHELRDDTVEGGALVAEALLTSAESSEVLSGLGDNIVEEVEGDTTGLGYKETVISSNSKGERGWGLWTSGSNETSEMPRKQEVMERLGEFRMLATSH